MILDTGIIPVKIFSVLKFSSYLITFLYSKWSSPGISNIPSVEKRDKIQINRYLQDMRMNFLISVIRIGGR